MIYLSFDQDWAPAWATRELVARLVSAGQRGTFFVTHQCPSLPLARRAGFELGWHPNFLPGSSHGDTTEAVLDTMQHFVPDAVGARAHCLIRGTPYLTAYKARGLHYDAADLHDGVAELSVHESWTGLARIPIFFEDDVHLARGLPCRLDVLALDRPGLQVFNFHPVLLALNAATPGAYAGLKADLAERGVRLTEATDADFAPHRETGGVADLLEAVLGRMQRHPERAGGVLRELIGDRGAAGA